MAGHRFVLSRPQSPSVVCAPAMICLHPQSVGQIDAAGSAGANGDKALPLSCHLVGRLPPGYLASIACGLASESDIPSELRQLLRLLPPNLVGLSSLRAKVVSP